MPSPQDYTTRREAYCAWLTANHINPNDVLCDADVYIETGPDGTRHIAYEACHRDAEGRKQVDERGDGVALERRTTPLLVEPPDWWEPYRKPTRDELLAADERVRALHRRNEHTGECEYCSARDYPDYSVPHPCETIQALNGSPTEDGP
jgi:hypothetical protein